MGVAGEAEKYSENSRVVVLMERDGFEPGLEREGGSITLEAALALPFFLTMILALMATVQVAITEIALQTAVSETAKQIAHHYEPVHWLQQKGEEAKTVAIEKSKLPSEIRPWLEPLLDQAADAALDHVLPLLFRPLVQLAADGQVLDKERLKVLSVKLPHPTERRQGYLELEAEYRMPLRLPFIQKEIILRKKAWEKAWYGGIWG